MINRHWVFGKNCGLDFSDSTSTSTYPINTHAGSASISDVNGNLIMYTDGVNVYNNIGAWKATLGFGSIYSSPSPLIVPDPGNAARYYVVTSSRDCGHPEADHHFGGILIEPNDSAIWGSTPLSSLMDMPPTDGYMPTGKLAAIRHANCRDFWVITIIQEEPIQVKYPPSILRVFLISPAGIQHVWDTSLSIYINNTGYLKGSRDGTRIAIANPDNPNTIPGNKKLLVIPFNNQTGEIDPVNMLIIPVPPVVPSAHRRWPYGIEFSSNGNILYYTLLGYYNVSSNYPGGEGYVFQHDLLNLSGTSIPIGVHPNNGYGYAIGALQLGDDNRIYIAQDAEQYLGVIANPDVLGVGCNLAFSALPLPEAAWCRLDLPSLIPRHNCSCKNINQNWVFGNGARLDFATSIPTPLSSSIGTRDGCASISDTNGNLIMYTDGLRVWDSTDNIRITGLHGSLLSTQSAVIIPHPGNAAQYYIFTTSGAGSGNHYLKCTLIDTNTWSHSPVPMPTDGHSPTEKLTAIQHVNRRDFWVVSIVQPILEGSTASGLGVLRIFLITPNDVHHYSDAPLNRLVHDRGYLKGSRDGKRIAMANWTGENVLVIPFDNSDASVNISGILAIPTPSIAGASFYGVEFSPDSNILYFTIAVSAEGNGYVFQCDLLSEGSWSQVGQPYSSVAFALGALQLGIDDRIYIAQYGKHYLGIIKNPNILGAGCTLTFDAIPLNGGVCLMGLPNLISNLCEPLG